MRKINRTWLSVSDGVDSWIISLIFVGWIKVEVFTTRSGKWFDVGEGWIRTGSSFLFIDDGSVNERDIFGGCKRLIVRGVG